MNLEQILEETNALVAAGYRELVISGINLGRWGKDFEAGAQVLGVRSPVSARRASQRDDDQCFSRAAPSEALSQRPRTNDQRLLSDDWRLASLVRAILDRTSLEKLRISSVEPMDWTDELIDLVASTPRIAKHAHVPMQSGSDAVLRRMHRKYRPWHYREKIQKIRAAMPSAAIGADVMVGFPGETDVEFEQTRRMVEELPFTYLHVFTYSARPGTPAAGMPTQVPTKVARERNRILRELGEQKKFAFMQDFVGHTLEAITLTKHRVADTPGVAGAGEITEALTDNYLKLQLEGKVKPNLWLQAKILAVENHTLIGTLI
jgi:threonylcarbamoyladenosine tRNA methylthiotransferase MtaB